MAAVIEALTFDWYGTLVAHRAKGRRRSFIEYLASRDLQSAPWDRCVLYDLFEYYGKAYKPQFSDDDKQIFWAEFTRQLFERFKVTGNTAGRMELHAAAIRDIFGSGSFRLYPDVQPVLHSLKSNGFRLAVISNWHCGLDSFCCELKLSALLDAVISSAQVGFEKPDSRVFKEAVRQLDIERDRIVHVGDLPHDDFNGAIAAGLRAILLDRSNQNPTHPNRIGNLFDLERVLRTLA